MKPSGAEFHGSIGISYHDVADVTSITAAATFLLKQLEPRNSVLVECFVDTLTLKGSGTNISTSLISPVIIVTCS